MFQFTNYSSRNNIALLRSFGEILGNEVYKHYVPNGTDYQFFAAATCMSFADLYCATKL